MTHEFTTGNGTFLAISIKEVGKYEISYLQGDPDLILVKDGRLKFITSLPEYFCERSKEGIINKAEIIGTYPTGFTEEMAVKTIDNKGGFLFDGDTKFYNKFTDYSSIETPFNGGNYFHTALESFTTLMEKEKIYTVNPNKKPTEEELKEHGWKSDFWGWKWVNEEKRVFGDWIIIKLKNKN